MRLFWRALTPSGTPARPETRAAAVDVCYCSAMEPVQSDHSRLDERSLAMHRLIDADTERAARVFMQRLEGKYPVFSAILFGSRARGTHTAESDADIAVILEGAKGNRYAIGGDMAGIAFDVMMETGVLVEALPLWADEINRPETFSNPGLILSIQRDGLRL